MAALALTATPGGPFSSVELVDYVLQQLDRMKDRFTQVFAEHCLAVLSAMRTASKLGDQVRLALHLLRRYQSDTHLGVRAMVTLAELYGLAKEVHQRELRRHQEQQSAPAPSKRLPLPTLSSLGIPQDGSDIKLVAMMMDLHREHRKIAGAGIRAFASMCRMSKEHLRRVTVDNLRALMQVEEMHSKSRSVALHLSEVLATAASEDQGLLAEGAIVLASSVLREFAGDEVIARNAVKVLRVCVAQADLLPKTFEVLQPEVLVAVGEAQCSDAAIAASVCEILALGATVGEGPRAELIAAGAAAVPVQVWEAVPHDSPAVDAAARSLKLLAYGPEGCEDAARHLRQLGVLVSLFKLLGVRPRLAAPAVRSVLAAIACFGQDKLARARLIRPKAKPEEVVAIVSKLLRVAIDAVAADPDVLAQVSCAVGVLTAAEDDAQKQARLRGFVDQTLLRQLLQQTETAFPDFQGGHAYCIRLIEVAPSGDLSSERFLSENGMEVHKLRAVGENLAAQVLGDLGDLFGVQREEVLPAGSKEEVSEEQEDEAEEDSRASMRSSLLLGLLQSATMVEPAAGPLTKSQSRKASELRRFI